MLHCTFCDAQYLKWQGQCAECGKWGTITQDNRPAVATKKIATTAPKGAPATITKLQAATASVVQRVSSGITEADRVLGGGLVPGTVVLLVGDPGIGKSTLVLQIAAQVAQRGGVLYASGEESTEQIARRAERLGLVSDTVWLLNETGIENIVATAHQEKPQLLIIDSVQTMRSESVESEIGGTTQVKAVGAHTVACAQELGIPVILIGHVTKEGSAAGPKSLEHLVDVVLRFEGDSSHAYRILRSEKNRYGASGEIGVFEMGEHGLSEVANPSKFFTSQRKPESTGVVTCAIREGSRILCVDVQALVQPSSYSTPKRTAVGIDSNKLNVLLAVLGKHAKEDFSKLDVAVSIAGGLKSKDPALDAALAVALVSAKRNRPVAPTLVIAGEVGLSGELRSVIGDKERLKNAKSIGYQVLYTGPGDAVSGMHRYARLVELLADIM